MLKVLRTDVNIKLVRIERLELSRVAPPPPQDGVSTNSTISAQGRKFYWRFCCLSIPLAKISRYNAHIKILN